MELGAESQLLQKIQLRTSWTMRFMMVITLGAPEMCGVRSSRRFFTLRGDEAAGFRHAGKAPSRRHQMRALLRRRLFPTTLTELNAMASAARIGCSDLSIMGSAATG